MLIDDGGHDLPRPDDFLDNNDTFTSDDLLLVPENVTAVPGEGKIRTVYGHTGASPLPWVLGGVGLLVVLVAWRVLRRRATEPGASG